MERLHESYSEYNDYEEQRADQMMDEYKDRYRESRASEDSVRDMFASLRGDRGDLQLATPRRLPLTRGRERAVRYGLVRRR
ncbi:hypothetical protein CIT26_20010 [Mesorhizobium temperatum]|uniref:Uncharacterized protein n=1 Tax=Mesorhizobium temperatum TaxID=241416 RepID=A0A271LJZ3_9HYPH|nr:hypothetical protein CIT26_20010 [Mesorhizobium temperatum]